MKKIRLLVLSDTHCGSVFGLTPKNVYELEGGPDSLATRTAEERKRCWDWFSAAIDRMRPINRLVLNGDMVEGQATRQGGLELLVTDPQEQVAIARRIVEYVHCDNVAITAGTAYHTGIDTDWERLLADAVGAKLGGHEYYTINGVTFDLKHHVGTSQIPTGRATALAHEQVWNALWGATNEFPDADVIVRSHVHYHVAVTNIVRGKVSMTTPALQTPGSRYGVRRMRGLVDYGFIVFDIYQNGEMSFSPVLWQGAETAWAQLPIDWS